MSNTCQHGQLARVCEMCEKDAEIARLREDLASMTELRKGERAKCESYDDENRYLREELAQATQREREALAMLLRYHIIRTCEFLPERRNEFYESPEVAAMLERAREQEVKP